MLLAKWIRGRTLPHAFTQGWSFDAPHLGQAAPTRESRVLATWGATGLPEERLLQSSPGTARQVAHSTWIGSMSVFVVVVMLTIPCGRSAGRAISPRAATAGASGR